MNNPHLTDGEQSAAESPPKENARPLARVEQCDDPTYSRSSQGEKCDDGARATSHRNLSSEARLKEVTVSLNAKPTAPFSPLTVPVGGLLSKILTIEAAAGGAR